MVQWHDEEKKSTVKELIVRLLILFVVSFVVIGLYTIGLKIFLSSVSDLAKERHTEKIDLCSVDTSDKLSVSFSLGYDYIEETDYYCCYRILEDGGKKYYKFEMDKTTIYETLESGEQAYVDVTTNGLGVVISYDLFVPKDFIIKKVDK